MNLHFRGQLSITEWQKLRVVFIGCGLARKRYKAKTKKKNATLKLIATSHDQNIFWLDYALRLAGKTRY